MRRFALSLVVVTLALLAWWIAGSGTPESAGPGTREAPDLEPAPRQVAIEDGDDPASEPSRAATARTPIDAARHARGQGILTVHVLIDTDDLPLPHVAVHVTARDGRDAASSQRTSVTDADGTARFEDIDEGPWVVTTDRSIAARDETAAEVSAGQTSEVTIRVPPGIDALIRVLDRNGGAIPGSTVLHWPANGQLDIAAWTPGEVVGRTDVQGELMLRALPNLVGHGSWFAARHPGHGASVARMVRSPADDEDRELRLIELVLGVDGAHLDLLILGADGRALAGATASIRPRGQPSSADDDRTRVLRQASWRARTGTDGRAGLGPLITGRYLLRVSADDHVRHQEEVRVDGDERLSRDVRLAAEARVHGIVTDGDGGPVAGADVRIQIENGGGMAEAGADGRFAVGRLGAGAATWVVRHERYADASGEIVLVAGEDTELVIEMERLARLHGRVVDERGAGLAGWRVVATADLPGYDDDLRRGETDVDGAFELPARSDLEYVLEIGEPGQTFSPPLDGFGAVRAREEPWIVRVPDDARATAFVEGRLVARDGAPAIEGRRLSIQREGPQRTWFGITAPEPETDSETGWFRIGPLPPGRYTLWIWSPDFASFPVPDLVLRPWQTTQLGEVREPAAGTIEVVLEAEPDVLLGDVLVQLEAERSADILRVDSNSLRARRDLLPGRYLATVYGDGFVSLKREIDVVAGEVTTLRATLQAGVRVGLRFHMPDGEEGAAFEVRDARGDLVLDTELEPGLATEDWWPTLSRGRFAVHAQGASGTAYFGEFAVETLEPRRKPIDLRLRPVR